MKQKKALIEVVKPTRERCRNPWNGDCRNTDIQLYIIYRGERLPICAKCWSEICESNLEWGKRALKERLRRWLWNVCGRRMPEEG